MKTFPVDEDFPVIHTAKWVLRFGKRKTKNT